MIRTQVSLEREQYEFLKERSRRTGDSLSALIRRAIDELRARESAPDARLLSLLGAFEADRDDVSVHHDDYLAGLRPKHR